MPGRSTISEGGRPTRLLVPTGYDGVNPGALLLVLHATNQSGDERYLSADPTISQHYLVAAPEVLDGVGSFESLPGKELDEVMVVVSSKLCYDSKRVFAVGNGSGGRALLRWIAGRERAGATLEFRALATIGAQESRVSISPTPLLFLHPLLSNISRSVVNDEDGTKHFQALVASNACGATTTPVSATSCSAAGVLIQPGCVDVDGCAAPLRFCHHDSPNGVGSGDPWPCFGTAAIAAFFEPFRR